MKFLEEKDMNNLCREVARRVYEITQNKDEVAFIIRELTNLINDDEFSFCEIESIIEFARECKKAQKCKFEPGIELYIDRVIKPSRRIDINRDILESQIDKLTDLTGVDKNYILVKKASISANILDSIIPSKEFNFRVKFEENMESFIEKVEKTYSNPHEGEDR